MNWLWSFILAGIGLLSLWVAGNHNKAGWMIGIIAQVLWFWYAIATEQFGFILSCFAYGWVYARNWLRWSREEAPDEDLRLSR